MTDTRANGPSALEWIGSLDAEACTDEGCSIQQADDVVVEPEGSDHAAGSEPPQATRRTPGNSSPSAVS